VRSLAASASPFPPCLRADAFKQRGSEEERRRRMREEVEKNKVCEVTRSRGAEEHFRTFQAQALLLRSKGKVSAT